jgi:hypothetical protein
MPRLLSRALLVLGGTAAATAAAWLLSSGTASADQLPPVPQAPAGVTVATPFETPLSSAVSSVADPVTDAGSKAVDVVTVPSQHDVLPLPAVPADSTGLGKLTTGLQATVGQLGDRLPVSKDLPTQLVQHLGRPVSTPAQPGDAVAIVPTTPRHLPMQPVPFAGLHSHLAANPGDVSGAGQDDHGTPHAPGSPGNSTPFGPLTVPAMPGGSGSGAGGLAGPAGLGLTSGTAEHLFPRLHVVDVLAPATVPAAVMPGKQPGVTPD